MVVEVVEAHEMLVVSVEAAEEVGWVLRMWVVKEALTAEGVAVEARDLLEE